MIAKSVDFDDLVESFVFQCEKWPKEHFVRGETKISVLSVFVVLNNCADCFKWEIIELITHYFIYLFI